MNLQHFILSMIATYPIYNLQLAIPALPTIASPTTFNIATNLFLLQPCLFQSDTSSASVPEGDPTKIPSYSLHSYFLSVTFTIFFFIAATVFSFYPLKYIQVMAELEDILVQEHLYLSVFPVLINLSLSTDTHTFTSLSLFLGPTFISTVYLVIKYKYQYSS